MKKDGFTLVELMAVIAIIAVLSVIIIPSLVTVNKNINSRLYNQKVDNIESAAELYASNNPDIFNGADRVYVTVYQLIEANYLEIDTKNGQGNCKSEYGKTEMGCVIDPRAEDDNGNAISGEDTVLNNKTVLIVKKNVGVTATLEDKKDIDPGSNTTLVDAICNGFPEGNKISEAQFLGYTQVGTEIKECECRREGGQVTGIVQKGTNSEVDACMIVSKKDSGDVDNWLKYGSTEANWRVLGLYWIDDDTSGPNQNKQEYGEIYPKMITSDVVQ